MTKREFKKSPMRTCHICGRFTHVSRSHVVKGKKGWVVICKRPHIK